MGRANLQTTTMRVEDDVSTGAGRHAAAAAAWGHAARRLRRLPRVSLGFALGFVVGAVFWHAVGFWSFVSTVVLKGPLPAVTASGVGDITTGSIVPVPATHRRAAAAGVDIKCTALELDRATGETMASLCTPRDVRWIKGARQGRADRLAPSVKATGWPARPVP